MDFQEKPRIEICAFYLGVRYVKSYRHKRHVYAVMGEALGQCIFVISVIDRVTQMKLHVLLLFSIMKNIEKLQIVITKNNITMVLLGENDIVLKHNVHEVKFCS